MAILDLYFNRQLQLQLVSHHKVTMYIIFVISMVSC